MEKINTLPIREKAVEVMKNLKEILDAYTAFSEEAGKINENTMLSVEYKGKQIGNAEEKLLTVAEQKFKNIYQCIDDIEETMKTNDSIYDFSDPEFSACISLMTATKEPLPYETLTGILDKFLGNRQALKALMGVAKSGNRDSIEKVIINTETVIERLRERVMNADVDFPKSVLLLPDVRNEFIKLSNLCGEELTQEETDLGASYTEVVMMQARSAMGLPVNER